MKRRLFEVVIVLFACVIFLGASFYLVDNYITSASSLGINGERFVAVNRQSAKARITDPEKNSSLYLKFTKNQKVHLQNQIHTDGGAAIVAVIKLTAKYPKKTTKFDPSAFEFGLLYDKSTAAGDDIISGRNTITGDFALFHSASVNTFAVSISVGRNDIAPVGFFLKADEACSIESVKFEKPCVGWDFSTSVPLYAFSNKGGVVEKLARVSYDFSDASSLFPQENSPAGVLPQIVIGFKSADDVGTWNKQKKVTFRYGGDEVTVRRAKNQRRVTVQLSAFKKGHGADGFGVIDFLPTDDVTSIVMYGNDSSYLPENGAVYEPFVSDLGFVMDWPSSNWRCSDYELVEWEEVPHVLFFDFANYQVQSDYLTRMAYFAEKDGYKGTLVNDAFVKSHHGYNAHDYRDKDMAAFFTLAHDTGFELNEREYRLRDILVHNGIIIANEDGTFAPGIGAIVSISKESPEYLRWQFLAHESWHGIYFTSQKFRDAVDIWYDEFDKESFEFIKVFWSTQPGLNYDVNDDYLMRNEFMAYIMQQTMPNIGSYFVSLTNRGSVMENEGKLADYVRGNEAVHFVRSGEKMNQWAFENYGFAAGRVNLIYKTSQD